ncbi:T9SS type A sorting domain-containing protein [Fluviicola taffensis]|uniref:T9SS type A sorting domain-containing protein n=1 Tax=Fluviicola taffensis TaxID=191579 RepID=UPI0031382616
MKNSLLAIILFLSYSGWGQNYKPIPETDATWIQAEFLYYIGHEHTTITSVLYTQNDTVINGISYCKLGSHGFADWVDNWGSQQNQTSGTNVLSYSTGCFRQDTLLKKVFLWNSSTQTDELLYDFGNLIVGQPYPATITNINYPYLLVMASDSVQLMDGNYYKRWVLGTNSSDSAYVSVIEGVGGTNGFTSLIYPVFEQSSGLLCHKTNTQHIYENWVSNPIPPRYSEECSQTLSIHQITESDLEIYPNPTNSAISIQTDKVIQSIELCNLNGQLLFIEKTSSGEKNLNLDLSKLETGTYILKIVLSDDSLVMERVQLIK